MYRKLKWCVSEVLSTKKARERGNNKINAASHRLGKFAVGAKLLAEAYKHQRLNQLVEVSFHGVALRGPENPLVCDASATWFEAKAALAVASSAKRSTLRNQLRTTRQLC